MPKKCKECHERFEQQRPLQYLCSIECATKYLSKKKKVKEKKDLSEMKKSLLTHKDYLKMLQVVFNNFIRERDKNKSCVSCGTFKAEEFHAGHYIATTYQYLRFNEYNCWKQCSKCNTHLRGNSIPYRIELINRIGLIEVERLENDRHKDLKLSVSEIQELISEYKFKLKELKNI